MNIKTIKRIAYLFSVGKNVRMVCSILKERYKIIATENEIKFIKSKYNIKKKDRREKYTEYQMRVLLRLFRDFYDNTKICWYLNKRFKFKINEGALTNIAFKKRIKKSKTRHMFGGKTSYLQQKQIAKDYLENNLSTKQLKEKYGYKTEKSIIDIVKKFYGKARTARQTKTLSKTYYGFDMKNVDCEIKAYYIGLLVTDGWVSKNRLFLDLIDKDVMEFLSTEINVSLTTRQRKNCKRSYRFSITYPSILEDIKRFGLVENKTHTLQPPNFTCEEQNFLPMFFRGVIDGDGWISQNGQEFFISSASKDFINYCKETLENFFGMEDLNLSSKNNFYVLRSHKQENISILKTKIYNKPFGMRRKYNRLYNS